MQNTQRILRLDASANPTDSSSKKPGDYTTGGAALSSPVDFVSGYLKQVFGFIGIKNVNIVAADQMNLDAEASFGKAQSEIEQKYSAIAA